LSTDNVWVGGLVQTIQEAPNRLPRTNGWFWCFLFDQFIDMSVTATPNHICSHLYWSLTPTAKGVDLML